MAENVMIVYSKFLKRKMMLSRIMGILCCLLALAAIVVYYFNLLNEWLCMIIIAYAAATCFCANSFLQDIKVGNPWQRINSLCAIAVYALTVFLIVYAFATKQISTMF